MSTGNRSVASFETWCGDRSDRGEQFPCYGSARATLTSVAAMDVAPLLDPQIAEILAAGPILGPLSTEALPTSRAAMERMADIYERTGTVESTDHVVTSSDGVEFAVRVHRPIGVDGPLPAVVWLHGGGLVAGTHRLDDGRFDRWCPKFGVVGIAVDYGLAPERPYPGPIEDSYAALRWVHDHAAELGIVRGPRRHRRVQRRWQPGRRPGAAGP